MTKPIRAILGNIDPRLWQYRPNAVSSVQTRPRANITQYGSSKLQCRLVSSLLYGTWAMNLTSFQIKTKNTCTWLITVSMGTVCLAKSQPEGLNLPQDYLAM